MSYLDEIITAAAGPLASLLLAMTASLTGRLFEWQDAYVISGVSFLFCIFNALPVIPLDGGRIIMAAAALTLGIEKAERLVCIMSCVVIFVLLIAGTILLLTTKSNFSLLLAAVWLLISYCKRSGVSIKSMRKMMEVTHG